MTILDAVLFPPCNTFNLVTNNNVIICSDSIYTVGNSNYNTTGIYVDTLQTVHGCDSVVTMDLVVNYSASSNDTVIACYDYIWNGNTYTSSGDYVDTLQTNYGCDSIANLNLTVVDLSVSIDTSQLNLVANIIGSNGPFDFLWNTGDTSGTIMPTANGLYWLVVIDLNGCISDTVYFDVTFLPNVGIVNIENALIEKVYPNPTFGNITIELIELRHETEVTLYDMYGKLVYSNKYQDTKQIEFIFEAPPGIYYLDLKSEESSSRHKIINQ